LTERWFVKKTPYTGLAAFLLIAAGLFWPAGAEAQVSLRTVVDLAQRNSDAVKIANAEVDRARAGLSETKDVFFPNIQFNTGIPVFPEVGFTGQPPSIWGATVQSLVYSIPQKHFIDSARTSLNAATVRLKDAQEQAALEASTAYIELDTVNQELAVAKQQQEIAGRLVEIVQQRTDAGVDPLSELLQARLTAANVKLARLHLETRAATLARQLATLTGLPEGSITPDHASIPEIPAIRADMPERTLPGIEAARLLARSNVLRSRGERDANFWPQFSFFAQYNRNTTLLNDVNSFFARSLPANNFASGINVSVPLLDMIHRARARESAADALRARVEAEQAEHQNDLQIASLTGTLRELDTQAEISSLKQQIAGEQLKTVETQLEHGNGGGGQPQLSPKAGQQARIDERQKYQDSLEAEFGLTKARLELLRALGHIEDWLNEVHSK
jgi:outer membrane protein TolC